jgi:hypothetical protein
MRKTGSLYVFLSLFLATSNGFAEDSERASVSARDSGGVGEVSGASEEGCSKVYSGSIDSQTKDGAPTKTKKAAVDSKGAAKTAK